jgi:acyl-CoA thioesterase FadM
MVSQAETLVLEAETFHVCAGPDEKPKRLPERLAALVAPYLREPAG